MAADIEMRGYTIPDAMAIVPPADGTPVPDGLAGLPRTPAAYRPAERFGNHQGLLINRALPIGGGK
ncbi:hypothetical protein GVO57_05700 [Sphingomonas changnyeongensis]|uniref:Uncharacterized protein n=1 Tax=Sphingomonas changnyeongensis TaxID=2698679 RepID=A0A7Z2NWB1_9SPHN|nr:hypothetical protein [Sphingomonas changnyeongensis]QHL90424.1 hypothetical protein GVO57_05700 [Sphingomonas changnyeongensis]